MFWIFLWIFCGILSAVVASNKGRSAFGWFILGFLFGPFGFILALVVSNQSATKHMPAPSVQSYKPAISGNTPVPVQGVAPAATTKMAKCPYCAEEVQPAAIKCKHCGEAIEVKSSGAAKIYKGYAITKSAGGYSVDGRSFVTMMDAERWINDQS